MIKKYKDFEKKCLTKMVVEIDITKCEKSFREIMKLISELEQNKLLNNNLEVKDIYWK